MTTMSLFDDFTTDPHHASRPATASYAFAWEATPDVTVTRRHTEAVAPDDAVSAAKDAVAKVQHRVDTLNRLFGASRRDIDALHDMLGDVNKALGAPKAELDMARLEIERLKRHNASIVKQAQEQSKRADAAERRADELGTALQRAKETAVEKLQAAATGDMFIIRRRTPGDSIRYFSSEVMKHAQDNLELAGIAMAMRMTAADIDDLPQGDHAR